MYSFLSDYSEGAHPRILDALTRTNLEQTDGYALDPHSEHAATLIKDRIGRDNVDYLFYRWRKIDPHHSAIRLVTSWATEEIYVRQFLTDLQKHQ